MTLHPCLPRHWDGYTLSYRHRSTLYRIQVLQTVANQASLTWTVDGRALDGHCLQLTDDGAAHSVVVRLNITEDPP